MRSISAAVKNINYISTTRDLEKYISNLKSKSLTEQMKWFYQPAYRYTSAEVGGHKILKEK